MFIGKYGSLDLYCEYLEKIFIVDHKQLQFDKNAGWNLFGICDKPDGPLSGHDIFCIHDDIFNRT